MEDGMSRRFTIKAKYIGKPLSFSAMAKKYGLRAADAAEVRAFIYSETDGAFRIRGKRTVGGKAAGYAVARKSRPSRSAKLKIHERRQTS
jgi:hypothetical protein